MLVNPSGRLMLLKLLHPKNAPFPMLVNPSGRLMLLKLLHLKNAYLPMLVTPSGISTVPVISPFFWNSPSLT